MSRKLFHTLSFVLLALSLMQVACNALVPAPKPSAAEVEKEEQAVYSFFLSDKLGPAVVLEETSTDIDSDNPRETVDYIKSGLTGISEDTLDSYLERNNQPGQLTSDMDLSVDYVLITQDELATIFNQPDGWDVFHEKYSEAGYSVVSRVGFNRTLDQALIYVGHMAGPLMGSGSYYLMEKQNGEWIIKEEIMVWIS